MNYGNRTSSKNLREKRARLRVAQSNRMLWSQGTHRESMIIHKLRRPLWHGTTRFALEAILEFGLLMGMGSRCPESEYEPGHAYYGSSKRIARCGVYLTESLETALDYAVGDPDDEYGVKKSDAVVIEIIALPKKGILGSDGFREQMHVGMIPPNCFGRVLSYRQAQALLKKGKAK